MTKRSVLGAVVGTLSLGLLHVACAPPAAEDTAELSVATPSPQGDAEEKVTSDGDSLAQTGLGCQSDSDCNDGDSCTVDFCSSGTCIHPVVACVNGQSCSGPILMLTGATQTPTWACTPNSNGQPSLTAHGSLDMTLECGRDVWVDPGAEAWDSACHPLTVHTYNTGHDTAGPGPNTCAEGTYSVQYIAWDSAGRTVSAIRSVKVDDTQPPTFKLKGSAHMTLQCGNGYVEPGWEAWDACYGNITPEVKVFGYPNGWVAGTYTVTYTLTDSGGNSAPTLTRTVDVVNCPY